MKTAFRVALTAVALAAGATSASATPRIDVGVSSAVAGGAGVEQARLVCDAWGRCWRAAPRYYRPYARPYYRPWGPPPPRFWGAPAPYWGPGW